MDCPWYLGFEATEECVKECTVTNENRDIVLCPNSASANDDFDPTQSRRRRKIKLKCLVKTDSGATLLIVDEYDSIECAYAELEEQGYRVYSISESDGNEFQTKLT